MSQGRGEMGVAFQRVIVLSEGVSLPRMADTAWVGQVTEYTVEHNAAMGGNPMATTVTMRVTLHQDSLDKVQDKIRRVLGEVQLELAMGTPPSLG